MRTVAIYTRVSTAGQSCSAQETELRQIAARAGWRIVEVYSDHGISGAKSRKDRPAFDRLLRDASRRRFDQIACWSVDRLGRSVRDLIDFLQEVRALEIGLYLHQQGIDSTTPAGTAMFQMLGVFAEFERGMIRERVLTGLSRARSQGKRLGRPPLPTAKTRAIREALLVGGISLRRIAAEHHVGLGSVQRLNRVLLSGPNPPIGKRSTAA
jgi:DNA invertase Pin-like site-specific DNA recombinase